MSNKESFPQRNKEKKELFPSKNSASCALIPPLSNRGGVSTKEELKTQKTRGLNAVSTQGKLDYLTLTHKSLSPTALTKTFNKIQNPSNPFSQDQENPFLEEGSEEENKMLAPIRSRSPHYQKFCHWFSGAALGLGVKGGSGEEMIVQIGGQGLAVMRNFGYTDFEILHLFAQMGFRCTRMDFAIDFSSQRHWSYIRQDLEKHLYTTRTKSINSFCDEKDQSKDTYYIGSKAHRETLICIYDKRKERNKELVNNGLKDKISSSPWYRLELRSYNGSKNDCCHRLFKDITQPFIQHTFSSALNQLGTKRLVEKQRGRISKFFRFLDPNALKGQHYNKKTTKWGRFEKGKFLSLKNIQRIPSSLWWQELVDNFKTYLPPKTEEVTHFEQYDKAIKQQCSKRLFTWFLSKLAHEKRDDELNYILHFPSPEKRSEALCEILLFESDKEQSLNSKPNSFREWLKSFFYEGQTRWAKQDGDFIRQVLAPPKPTKPNSTLPTSPKPRVIDQKPTLPIDHNSKVIDKNSTPPTDPKPRTRDKNATLPTNTRSRFVDQNATLPIFGKREPCA